MILTKQKLHSSDPGPGSHSKQVLVCSQLGREEWGQSRGHCVTSWQQHRHKELYLGTSQWSGRENIVRDLRRRARMWVCGRGSKLGLGNTLSKIQAWLCIPVIPCIRRQRQEDKYKTSSLSYVVRLHLKNQKPKKTKAKKTRNKKRYVYGSGSHFRGCHVKM